MMSSNDQQYKQSPTVNRSADMNDIPNELLPLIFKHLTVKDLVRCRMVCKRFLFFCDEVKVTDVIVTNKVKNKKDFWFYTKDQFNHQDGMDVHTFIKLRSKFGLNQLKRLYFKGTYEDCELLNLNDLNELQQLTIHFVDNCRREGRLFHINLPNLKILHELYCSDGCNLQLNTPKLEMLRSQSFSFMTIHHPDTIKHFEMRCLIRHIDSLKNVRYLKLDDGLPRDQMFLSAYPKLETLLFNFSFVIGDDENGEFSEEEAKEFNLAEMSALRQLYIQRPELTIYFQSVELHNVEKIDEYDPENHMAFQINNYDSLCDDVFHDSVYHDYNELMRLVNGTLPDDFFKKYANLRSVTVSENVENAEHFVEFLTRLEFLHDLSLENVSFDQGFYDRLPEMDQLSYLFVGKGVRLLNFDFLFKMNNLKILITEHESAEFFNLTLALFGRLKYFRQITFQFNGELFRIYKSYRNDEYSINREKENSRTNKTETIYEKRELSHDELVRLLGTYMNTCHGSHLNQ